MPPVRKGRSIIPDGSFAPNGVGVLRRRMSFAPAVKNSRLGVSDEDRAVRQARPGFARGDAVEPKSLM